MTLSGFLLLFAAVPVLLLGEWMTRVIGPLRRSHIPPPVVSGLLVALLVLVCNELRPKTIVLNSKVETRWLSWLVLPQAEWRGKPGGAAIEPTTLPATFPAATTAPSSQWVYPKVEVYQPLLIGFFTCIGLNASWSVARKGGTQLLLYLVIASVFAVAQSGVGVGLAFALNQNPLLGLQCGGVALMGGFGTAAGFSASFEQAGLAGAAVIGTAAAAFGVIAGSLVGGPVGRRLVEKHVPSTRRAAHVDATTAVDAQYVEDVAEQQTFLREIASLFSIAGKAVLHIVILLACIKAGAWLYSQINGAIIPLPTSLGGATKLNFPVYMGALIVGVILRNVIDLLPRPFIESDTVDKLASVCLSWMLAVIIMSLKLTELIHSAGPMLVILVVQVIFMVAFAYWIVFWLMGRDYDAATMSVGMIGFGLGATSNAVATMKQMTKAYGPAPRAFLIVTVVGAFLIDFTNSIIITAFMNFLK